MNQFRRELTDEQEKNISGANRKAINHEIQKMQARLGREKSLCRLSRIERFLDAMEQVEKIVTIFLNVSEVMAFIWVSLSVPLAVPHLNHEGPHQAVPYGGNRQRTSCDNEL